MKSPDHQDNATLGITLVFTAMFFFAAGRHNQDPCPHLFGATDSLDTICILNILCTGDFYPQETITRLLKK
jgi:hypothetical protein